MLNLQELPREIRDRLELKAGTDQSFYRALEEDYTDDMMQTLNTRSQVEKQHSFIGSMYGTQGSGKSWGAIALCKILDPNFSVDRIYFNYDDLVQDKKNLKPGDAVLIDEQSESYGIDSHRVLSVLSMLKEQMRKKSIHFIFCSPTLKPEYQSSMYVVETMFIDYETRECYAAYKTRELLTLGYVRIPSPEELVGKEFLEAYEAKKDMHLDRLTGSKQVDDVEDRATQICETKLFKTAEAIYVAKMGYMPMTMLLQVIGKLYPDYKGSVIVGELANRIKLNREMSGAWVMSGVSRAKRDKGT